MARARTIRPNSEAGFLDDPIDEAVAADRQNTADELTGIFEQMQGYDQGDIKGVLYKIPRGGGKYEYVEEHRPPFDPSGMLEDLKERFGGGDFQLRIFVGGKIKKNVNFSIATVKAPLTLPKDDKDGMLPLMMQMMMQSSDRQMQMMMAMNSQAQEAGRQQTQLMVTMITGMMAGQAKPTDLLPLISAMRDPKPEGGGMGETLELLKTAKGLFGGGGEGNGSGFDAEDFVSGALKIAGPVASAIGKAVAGRGQPQAVEVQAYDTSPQAGPLTLPGMEDAPQALALPQPGTLLDLVREDVLFMFQRRYDPQLAAEAVLDRLDAAGVTEGAVNELVVEITAEGDPWEALARRGLDLRANLPWAEQFFQGLIQLHAEAGRDGDDTGGDGGGEGDASDHGPVGAGRIARHADPQSRGERDHEGLLVGERT